MNKLSLYLLTTLLTFTVSFAVSSGWNSYNSVDKRFESAIYAVNIQNITRNVEKICKTISPEKCEKFEKQIEYKSVSNRAKQDVINANIDCQEKNLSDAECTARKEAAISDIEKNMLDQDVAKSDN